MTYEDEKGEGTSLDMKLLSRFLYQLNIARRHVGSYPQGHPQGARSAEKALVLLDEVLSFREELVLWVSRDSFKVGDGYLDKENPVLLSLAKDLFACGISAVTFLKNIQISEFVGFLEALARESDDGGGPVFPQAGRISVTLLDYTRFAATEEDRVSAPKMVSLEKEAESLWKGFIEGLALGNLDPSGGLRTGGEAIDTATLAELLNEKQSIEEESKGGDYEKSINTYLKELDRENLEQNIRGESMARLGSLVGELRPELRAQFLNMTFESSEIRRETAEELVQRLPDDAIYSTLELVNVGEKKVSPILMKLLQRLSQETDSGGGRTTSRLPESAPPEGMEQNMRVLFREEDPKKYVPESYQQALLNVLSAGKIEVTGVEKCEEFEGTMTPSWVANQVTTIIFELLTTAVPGGEKGDVALSRNLLECCHFFLDTGNFSSLLLVYRRLKKTSISSLDEVVEAYADPDFIEEVLFGLETWGREKQEEIGELICCVGAPFAAPLVECLADDENMSRRKFYIGCLIKMGEEAREAVIASLGDARWYLVRNMVVVLRACGDRAVLPHIHRLASHPHPGVRKEVIRALRRLEETVADRLLLQDLDGKDSEMRQNAVALAEESRSLLVLNRLLDFIEKSTLEFRLRSSAIRSLAEMGNPEALHRLERLLRARSLLRPFAANRLKLEIVRSLEKYPGTAVRGILLETVRCGQAEVAALAANVLKNHEGAES